MRRENVAYWAESDDFPCSLKHSKKVFSLYLLLSSHNLLNMSTFLALRVGCPLLMDKLHTLETLERENIQFFIWNFEKFRETLKF